MDDHALKRALDRVRRTCDVDARRAADPVGAVHRYREVADQELVALVAASIAFGNVKTIRSKLADLLARLGPEPARAAEDLAALKPKLRGWKHRVYRSDEVARLLYGARRVQLESGSLGARFEAAIDPSADDPIRDALVEWCAAIREAGRLRPSHLFPDPGAGSSCKRLMLFLRWMIRPADGVDLGLWNVDPALLLIPVDTHIHKLSANLGLTSRKTADWKTAREITTRLRVFDPADPVKYDFSLCHLGMIQGCPSERDAVRCRGCGVMPVCRHWRFVRTS